MSLTKKPIPRVGTGRNPWCHPASSSGQSAGRPLVRHAGQHQGPNAPGTDNGCPLRPRLRPMPQGVRMEAPRSIQSLRARRLTLSPGSLSVAGDLLLLFAACAYSITCKYTTAPPRGSSRPRLDPRHTPRRGNPCGCPLPVSLNNGGHDTSHTGISHPL